VTDPELLAEISTLFGEFVAQVAAAAAAHGREDLAAAAVTDGPQLYATLVEAVRLHRQTMRLLASASSRAR
jgi:hypothetical protein